MLKTELPDWLEEALPSIRPHATATLQDEAILITYADDEKVVVHTLEELHNATLGIDFCVSKKLKKKYGKKGYILSYKLEDGYVALLMEMNDEKRKDMLLSDYNDSLKKIQAFVDNPSFISAWQMINAHPAFWLAHDIENHPFSWETNNGCSLIDINAFVEDNSTLVLLSTGSHISQISEGIPAYSTRYTDWRLEVSASTYEEGIIELARRVLICFNNDGTKKSDDEVESMIEKPNWVLNLEKTNEKQKIIARYKT